MFYAQFNLEAMENSEIAPTIGPRLAWMACPRTDDGRFMYLTGAAIYSGGGETSKMGLATAEEETWPAAAAHLGNTLDDYQLVKETLVGCDQISAVSSSSH